jgi:hypothetical protein
MPFRFDLRYDEEFLYCAVLIEYVNESPIETHPKLDVWMANYPGGDNSINPLFTLFASESDGPLRYLPSPRAPAGLETVSVRKGSSCAIELRVPHAFFAYPAPGGKQDSRDLAEEYVRMNLVLSDGGDDLESEGGEVTVWRPVWGTTGDYAWSGVFRLK